MDAGSPTHLLRRSRRSTGAGLLVGLVLALLSTFAPSNAVGAGAPATATDQAADQAADQAPASADRRLEASRDRARLPASCAGPGSSARQTRGGCRLTRFAKRPTIMMWGDSHAWQQLPSLVPAARLARVNVVAFVMGSCPPARVPLRSRGENYPGFCEESNAFALDYAERMARGARPFSVVLGSNWAGFRDLYRRIYIEKTVPRSQYDDFVNRMLRLSHRATGKLFTALGQARVRVDVLDQAATVPEAATCPEGRKPFVCSLPRSRMILHEPGTRRWLAESLQRVPGARRLIDVNKDFCNAQTCFGFRDDIFTFADDLHISASRARTRTQAFVPSLRGLR